MMTTMSTSCQLENSLINEYDIYTQQYFLWLFGQLLKQQKSNPESVFDGADGVAWLTKKALFSLNKIVIFF